MLFSHKAKNYIIYVNQQTSSIYVNTFYLRERVKKSPQTYLPPAIFVHFTPGGGNHNVIWELY